MQLTPEEFGILNNSRFLLVKADVVAKVRAEFEQLEGQYLAIVNKEGLPFLHLHNLKYRGEKITRACPIWC